MRTDTDVRPAPGAAPAPARVVDLTERAAAAGTVPVPGDRVGRARRDRLVRLQALDVQRAALLHARVTGRRRSTQRPV